MRKVLRKLSSPTALLYLFLVVAQLAAGVYLARGAEPPPAFSFLYPLGLLWAVGWWMRDDSRGRGVGWVFDMGLFLYVAWPFVIPYYLLKTRGAKGLLVILGCAAVYVGALLAGAALYILLTP
ncbi:MAG TPA: hypothetical protein VF570_06750 [Pyrinomonadaceae bacterium]|jgi:hypothetical protein